MARRFRTLVFASLGLLVSVPTAAAAFGNGRDAAVTFSGLANGLTFEGKTSELSVSEKAGKVRFVVPLAKLDTGIELRNSQMREKYLEVGKYPNAELVVDRSALKVPANGQEASGSAPGTLTIHGRSRPVTVSYTAKRSGASSQIAGTVRLNIGDYGIPTPSYLGVSMKTDISISIRAKVDD